MLDSDFILDETAEPVEIKQLDLTYSDTTTLSDANPFSDSDSHSPFSMGTITPSMRSITYSAEYFNQFLDENEKIVLTGPVWKKKTFLTVKRQLVLTDKPRILVIDSELGKVKKEINWTSPLTVILKSKKSFDLITV